VVRPAGRHGGALTVAVLPAIAYPIQMVAAMVLPDHPSPALFRLGGATVLLLFTGIHNAWDAAAYIALASAVEKGAGEAPTPIQATNSTT
jgi:hypothetical protein